MVSHLSGRAYSKYRREGEANGEEEQVRKKALQKEDRNRLR